MRLANFNEEIVYCLHDGSIEQVTITLVIEFPDRDYWSTLVSFESRKGICYCPRLKAYIALPKQDKDRFIFLASYNPYPVTLVLDTFSLPAKSTKFNFDILD